MPKKSLQTEAQELSLAHWQYVNTLYEILNIKTLEQRNELGFHYKTAFIHGFKHGVKSKKEAV